MEAARCKVWRGTWLESRWCVGRCAWGVRGGARAVEVCERRGGRWGTEVTLP